MAKDSRKIINVKAICCAIGVVGYLVRNIDNRSLNCVVYDSMSDILDDYPILDNIIKIDGIIKKEDLLQIASLW